MPLQRNRKRNGQNDPRYAARTPGGAQNVQTIAEPNDENIVTVLQQLKEAVETISGARGAFEKHAVTFNDLANLGLVTVKDNGDIQNNVPFNTATENSRGTFKFCDGEHEDFGAGEGWYIKLNDGWYKLTVTGPYI